jgi:hypothetical protein
MPDLWNECFNPSMNTSPNDFERMFCRQCRNPTCDRSAGSGLRWLKRILTQEDRLLNNPKFADPNDPHFREIRSVDFPSALKEAMKIEISDRRGDWTIPTEADAMQLAAEMRSTPLSHIATPPVPLVAPAPSPPVQSPTPVVEDDDEAVGRILRRMDIAGSGKSVYQVTLIERIAGRPEWMCTCKAFEFGRARPCKHIEYAMTVPDEEPTEPKPIPAGPPPSKFQAPPPPKSNTPEPKPPGINPKQPFYPTQPNIAMPSGGIMIDGSAPPPPKERVSNRPTPQADPWAPPPVKPNVIPVGGKVVLGGKPPGGKT